MGICARPKPRHALASGVIAGTSLVALERDEIPLRSGIVFKTRGTILIFMSITDEKVGTSG
jgi:hypothetical protein